MIVFIIKKHIQMYIFYNLLCSIQVREFDDQRLYGNVSGYIGFFLGYSLFQIPNFFLSMILFLRKIILRLTNIPINDIQPDRITTLNTKKKNTKERNIYEDLDQFKMEFYELRRKFQELQVFITKWNEKLERNESIRLDN